MHRLEQFFERVLWASRLMVMVPVVASVFMALITLFVATVDVAHVVGLAVHYAAPHSLAESAVQNAQIVTLVVKAVDGYLLTAILLIFALGLYELFISKIEAAETSEVSQRLLLIRSLDDLKDRLAKVVVLILVITFFQRAVELTYTTARDVLYLALGTLLVGGALFLSSRKGEH